MTAAFSSTRADGPSRLRRTPLDPKLNLDSPELTEPTDGIFALASEYEDRGIPKNAGFRWHPGDRCRAKDCSLCEHELGKIWWTDDILKALELLQYAEADLKETILERAGPAGEARREADRVAAREAKIKQFYRARIRQASCALDADIDVPKPEGRDYMPYQRAAIAFAVAHPSVLFADEMGLGKTVEAIGVLNADPDAQRILIVCPASLKLNWARECERWLMDRGPVGVAGKTFPYSANVVIVNYDILGKWQAELSDSWDVLIADECHYVKNKTAKRSKALYAIEARRKLFLTGTPLLNKPVELWPIVSALDPKEFEDFWEFARRYCKPKKNRFGWEFNGATNLDHLHDRLRSTIMVRRTKSQVLPDLPPKRRQVIELASDHIANLIAVETEAWQEHRARLQELRAASNSGAERPGELEELRKGIQVAFGELAKLRQATAIAKVPLIVEHLRSVLDDTQKVVVFAHHQAVIHQLAEAFEDAAVTLTGADDPTKRQAAVDRFQEDQSCRLFIGSIKAAGFGLTLTAAAHVVFAELDWVPAHLTQAEDRTHRLGQEDSVLVQHLVLEDSLDARMVGTLIKKQRVIDQVVDGSEQADLFDAEFAESLMEAAQEDAPPAETGEAPAAT